MTEQQDFCLHNSIGYWVNRLAMTMRVAFERELASHGVTVQQWSILIACFREQAQTPMELAKVLDIDGSAVTRLLDRLEAKGLLVRRFDTSDRRSIQVELTPAGRDLAPKLIPISKSINKKFLKGLTDKEVEQFKSTIAKMLTNADGS